MRALLVLCALARVAHADRAEIAETRDCVELAEQHTVELAGDTVYAIHDSGLGYNELFVISLAPEPKLLAKAVFTQMYPQVLHVTRHQLLIAGALPQQAPRVVTFDVTDPAAPKLLPGETPAGAPACSYPAPQALTEAVREGDVAIVPVQSRSGAFLAVLRDGEPPAAIDHAALVTENHWEFIRSLPHGECSKYQWPCTDDYLRRQLRAAAFELVAVRGGLVYSLSTAGLAVHRLDTLALAGSLRWPTMQGVISTWF